uniref:Uncharacterized protein n=1 Tax=Anguilla anguilla TaxID=7936 RepID=A0A0E9T3B2_ANGAN
MYKSADALYFTLLCKVLKMLFLFARC